VSEYRHFDTLGVVKSYFSSFLRKKLKKIEIFFLWCSDVSEDQAICLFAGLLANPDMPLSLGMSSLVAQTSLYAEDRGLQAPMSLEHGNIVET
jgi:hypothetical protein